jgi:hypothetical protein
VTVCFGNGVEVSRTVDATVDVRIVYNLWDTYIGGGLHVEVWTGWDPYYEESILFTGERPIAPLTTVGSPHYNREGLPCSHDDPPWGHLYCIDGDTPPCQPWDSNDPTLEPTAFPMGDCLTQDGGNPPFGEWPHAAGNGHLDLPGTVTYALNPQQRNMGHYFITCPEITAPCGCLRGESGSIGIHGGGHFTLDGQEDIAKEMAVSQQITPTWGCIRIYNGCPICARNHALQALGDYHKRVHETHHHPIYLFVPYLPGP